MSATFLHQIGICIPTLNPGQFAETQAASLSRQTLKPGAILVIDSCSTDGSLSPYHEIGATVMEIDPADFNHGGTRQRGADSLGVEIVVFMTQDAILARPDTLSKLLECFEDPEVAAAYGRQLPRSNAGAIEAHARLFNYQEHGRKISLEDRKSLGIKAVFFSNSFAAYRYSDLVSVGGFPSNLILGEDSYVAAKMLSAGKKIAYCAESMVYHSHDYGFGEEFKRYFDTGVFHARAPWIRLKFGQLKGEGTKYVMSELRYLARKQPLLIPSAMLRTAFKLAGFKLGLKERLLPVALKRRLSMNRSFWQNQVL